MKKDNSFKLTTPILFVIFNRPAVTQQVFEMIREVRPEKLYVAADGPRPGVETDKESCQQARDIIEQVDWPCKVTKLFRKENLGCGKGPSNAISWFFEQEEKGIILEDDCLPDPAFFRFCQELLDKYRDDSRVMHIGGCNYQDGWVNDSAYSYYFSHYGHEWGWATWRRAWELYDFGVETYPEVKQKGYLNYHFTNFLEKQYRLSKIEKTRKNLSDDEVNWWDYQWEYTKLIHNGLSVIPNKNLVRNIGFSEDATHTKSVNDVRANNEVHSLSFPLKHPPFVIRDAKADKRYFYRFLAKVILLRKVFGFFKIKGFSLEG